MIANSNLRALAQAGVSVWLDDLSRQRIVSGNLTEWIRDYGLAGVTSNPTIFAKAMSNGKDYSQQLDDLANRGVSADEAAFEITTTDVRDACDLFRPVYDSTGGLDGRVSLEVDPRLAYDTDRTVTNALELWKAVDRPNVMIKIPATVEGLPAITRTLAEGVSVNVTLVFSLDRYQAVMDAYMAGLEQARAQGHDLGSIASVASFFVSRVDTEVDQRLDNLSRGQRLRGQAAIANARLAYAAYQDTFASQRWRELEQSGARRQRPLWASTGVKDPSYSDTSYVEELVAPNTVNTMPEATLRAVADHATIRGDRVIGTVDSSQRVFDELTTAGIDLDDVFAVLESQGVDRFAKSWAELLHTVEDQLSQRR